MAAKKHLEINPDHSIVETLRTKAEADKNDKAVKVIIFILLHVMILLTSYNNQFLGFGHALVRNLPLDFRFLTWRSRSPCHQNPQNDQARSWSRWWWRSWCRCRKCHLIFRAYPFQSYMTFFLTFFIGWRRYASPWRWCCWWRWYLQNGRSWLILPEILLF